MSPEPASVDPGLPQGKAETYPGTTTETPKPEMVQEVGPPPGLLERYWLQLLKQHSHLVVAIMDVKTYGIQFANQQFYRLLGLSDNTSGTGSTGTDLLTRLRPADQLALQQLYRRHMLNAILAQRYGITDAIESRFLHEPLILSLPQPDSGQDRLVELRLRCDRIAIVSLRSDLATALDACWDSPPDATQVMAQLLRPEQPLAQVMQTLSPDRYEATGSLLLEGMDVTERELTKTLIQLLVSQDSILEPACFQQINHLMTQLFRADGSLILSAESHQAKLFLGLDQPERDIYAFSVHSLHSSLFFQASQQGQVLNIPDLSRECPSDCERQLYERGVRSLLIIPLMVKSIALDHSDHPLLGLVGLTSHQPYAFNQADCHRATTLIPALTAALRHSSQTHFTAIHPAVRWRFEQEAERRSWGLPPHAIVFEAVYPLYGISDIRGSSDERNQAIQADLVTQFRLGLAILKAVAAATPYALPQRLREDLEQHLEQLQQGISVDAEVSLLRYLQTHLEAHFDSFAQDNPGAQAAIAAYQTALDPDYGCVYQARAHYDQTIATLNEQLRDTWNRWQQTMQAIIPHYCDIETTDGIDHMIYAGRSIDSRFTPFHLRSLRYEQLRAICDCARTAYRLQTSLNITLQVTHLVLVQETTVDICHDETTERLFDVRGTHDTRYEIVKKRIDKACEADTQARITQPGCLTVVYSTAEEWTEYGQYLQYLQREGWIGASIYQGNVEPLQGVTGLKFARVEVLP